jgi:hypothetical protein
VDRPLARPDHFREVDGLRVVTVTELELQHPATAMDRIGDARRRLIRAAEEETSRPHLAIKPVNLSKRSVSSDMSYLRLACQAFMLALGLRRPPGAACPSSEGARPLERQNPRGRILDGSPVVPLPFVASGLKLNGL